MAEYCKVGRPLATRGRSVTFKRAAILATLVVGLLVPSIAAAKVSVDRSDKVRLAVHIEGLISQQDAVSVEALGQELKYKFLDVFLNSEGGDVFAATRIGRFVRKFEGTTIAGPECLSSCALIYIAGVTRSNLGVIGLHRPYLAGQPRGRLAVEHEAETMLKEVQSYVAEMGVTNRFYEEMVNTEPSQMRTYVLADIDALVPAKDPISDEVTTAREARAYGVTTDEIRRRQVDAEKCFGTPQFASCYSAALWGLSRRVYEERAAKAKVCALTPDEHTRLDLIPIRERWNNSLLIEQEDCRRRIMLDLPGSQ
jgi:hypothetical protein